VRSDTQKGATRASIADEAEGEKHSLAMSWEDLSVWCYSCGSYFSGDGGEIGGSW
jgi:hypothetical protein